MPHDNPFDSAALAGEDILEQHVGLAVEGGLVQGQQIVVEVVDRLHGVLHLRSVELDNKPVKEVEHAPLLRLLHHGGVLFGDALVIRILAVDNEIDIRIEGQKSQKIQEGQGRVLPIDGNVPEFLRRGDVLRVDPLLEPRGPVVAQDHPAVFRHGQVALEEAVARGVAGLERLQTVGAGIAVDLSHGVGRQGIAGVRRGGQSLPEGAPAPRGQRWQAEGRKERERQQRRRAQQRRHGGGKAGNRMCSLIADCHRSPQHYIIVFIIPKPQEKCNFFSSSGGSGIFRRFFPRFPCKARLPVL